MQIILKIPTSTTKGEKQKPPGQSMSPNGKLLVSSWHHSKSGPPLHMNSQCMLDKAMVISAFTLRLCACCVRGC